MYCMNCGTQLPDTAKFCAKCGQPTATNASAVPVPEPNVECWETCEIVFAVIRKPLFGEAELHFIAQAAGPHGGYKAGESLVFKGSPDGPQPDNLRHAAALSDLVKSMVRDGWELEGESGQAWYSQKFRRACPPEPFAGTPGPHAVVLLSCGPKKIEVIKTIRQLTNLGLVEAKNISETPGAVVIDNISMDAAIAARKQLEDSGGTAQIR
jgi:hypothetical protein